MWVSLLPELVERFNAIWLAAAENVQSDLQLHTHTLVTL
jgi:hypothetical protein